MLLNKQDFQHKFNCTEKSKFAVAFSGGGDSTALLYWLANNYDPANIYALHFNHNLREESESEQNLLATFCQSLGVNFIFEKWLEKPEGNIQQSARNARYKFFNEASKQHGFDVVYTGHNQDDIAETVLMRLARGSGLKGLSAMAENTTIQNAHICRPLLGCSRVEIRKYLTGSNVKWLEDSSNENDKFFRVRVRKHKKELEKIGISFESIVASSLSLQRAEHFINSVAEKYYKEHAKKQEGCTVFSDKLLSEEDELTLRIVDKIISDVTGEKMLPRTSKKQRLINHLKKSEKRYELGGVAFYKSNRQIYAKKV